MVWLPNWADHPLVLLRDALHPAQSTVTQYVLKSSFVIWTLGALRPEASSSDLAVWTVVPGRAGIPMLTGLPSFSTVSGHMHQGVPLSLSSSPFHHRRESGNLRQAMPRFTPSVVITMSSEFCMMVPI